MPYIGVTEEKKCKFEEDKMGFSVFILIYSIYLVYLKVHTTFETTGSKRN